MPDVDSRTAGTSGDKSIKRELEEPTRQARYRVRKAQEIPGSNVQSLSDPLLQQTESPDIHSIGNKLLFM